MNDTPIDLRTCKPGDKLRSKHGLILTYIGPTEYGNPYDHWVQYPDEPPYGPNSRGTRSHDGRVSLFRSLPTDHDIVEIIPV